MAHFLVTVGVLVFILYDNGATRIFTLSNGIYFTIIAGHAVINAVVYYLLRTPTVKGRLLQEHIAGFKMFLAATETERMKFLNPPEKTPELFDKYLPYAIALGVEKNWSNQFSVVLTSALQTGQYHQPAWYQGYSTGNFNYNNFSSSLSTAIVAASAGSSAAGGVSGFGGGGSSGGGFGGGGGGGW